MAFPTGWARRAKLTIQNAKIGSTLTDFPVLLTQTALSQANDELFDADGSHPAINGGGDIRFSSDEAGATQLACEIVDFTTNNTPANGTCEIWVNTPSVASASDTDIYIWWEKSGETQPAEGAAFGKHATWNSDFAAVYHLEEASGTLFDSTSNSVDMTAFNTPTFAQTGAFASGAQGKSMLFDDASSEYLRAATAAITTAPWTLSAWGNTNDVSVGQYLVNLNDESNDGHRWGINMAGNVANDPVRYFITGAVGVSVDTSNFISVNTWHHIAAREVANNDHYSYLDMDVVNKGSSSTSVVPTNTDITVIGVSKDNTPADYMSGLIDEARIASIALSEDWLSAEYENQNDPPAFIVDSAPEAVGGGSVLKRPYDNYIRTLLTR